MVQGHAMEGARVKGSLALLPTATKARIVRGGGVLKLGCSNFSIL